MRKVTGYLGRKIFFLALDQHVGSFSDFGAHQDLQKPNFSMPELLIKELCEHPRLRLAVLPVEPPAEERLVCEKHADCSEEIESCFFPKESPEGLSDCFKGQTLQDRQGICCTSG